MRRRLSRQRIVVLGVALAVALSVLVMFTVRAFEHARDLRHRVDEPIQAWMTIPYVAHAYRVPPPVLVEALGLSPGSKDRRPLGQIATSQGRSFAAVKADALRAIDQFRAAKAPPAPPRPDLPDPLQPPTEDRSMP